MQRYRRDSRGLVEARTFIPVTLNEIDYLADVITGALYVVTTGQCLTGRLHLVDDAAPPRPVTKSRKRWSKAQESCGFSNETMIGAPA